MKDKTKETIKTITDCIILVTGCSLLMFMFCGALLAFLIAFQMYPYLVGKITFILKIGCISLIIFMFLVTYRIVYWGLKNES